MIKTDVYCLAKKHLGNFPTVDKCAEATIKANAKYFAYGKGSSRGECFREDTKSADCPEGFKKDKRYDFYSTDPNDEPKKEETT